MDLPLGVGVKEFNRLNSEFASLKEELEAEEKKAEQEFPLWVKEMTKRAEGAGFQVPIGRSPRLKRPLRTARRLLNRSRMEAFWHRQTGRPFDLSAQTESRAGQVEGSPA